MGYSREHAVRVSMLMSIPVIIAATALSAVENHLNGNDFNFKIIVTALIFSYLAAYLAIAVMLRFLHSFGFLPYIVYRILLGAGLILWAIT
jgi:undecaprenyl-diphosphatase